MAAHLEQNERGGVVFLFIAAMLKEFKLPQQQLRFLLQNVTNPSWQLLINTYHLKS